MIRLANIDDLNQVMICINDAKNLFKKDGSDQWQDLDNYPNESTMTMDINRNELYVYVDNNQILGCIVLSRKKEECYDKINIGNWKNTGPYMVLHRLAVRNDSYRKGIAKSLIDHCIKLTKENNIKSIKVDTKHENIRMINLLTKCGFEKRGIVYLLREDVLDKERVVLEKVV